MPDFPHGTFPIVFESGVVRFDDDGTLNVHLSHSAEAPHPMQVQEHDDNAVIPGAAASAVIRGGQGGLAWRARASMPETDDLPDGFVFTIKAWSTATVEMSGDLSILVQDAVEVPSWFVEGKVHRFAGPDKRLRLWSGSAKPPEPPARPKPAARPAGSPTHASPKATSPSASSSGAGASPSAAKVGSPGGCLSVLLLGALVLPVGLALLT